ncbi:MAG TPA: hypothetical protein PK156_25260 [Polyangium sp.]|nr:hypothetical protein [Polyangium sp.]
MRTASDPYFRLPEVAPQSPGASPFRMKGDSYNAAMLFLNGRVPGGFSAVVAAMTPEMQSFFKQSFRPGDWYDVVPNPYMHLIAARLRGIPFRTHIRDNGAWHADHAMRGSLRTLLRVFSHENVATWLPRISANYHDFGRCETKAVGPGRVRGVRNGMPRALVPWYTTLSASFCEKALSIVGAKDPHMLYGQAEPEGTRGGQDIYSLHFEITWS